MKPDLKLRNAEAESALLGAIMLNPDTLTDALRERVAPESFSAAAHGRIFRALSAVIDATGDADPAALHAELDKVGDYESVGGNAYLAMLSASCPAACNAAQYARLIVECANRRTLRAKLEAMLQAYDADPRSAQQIANDGVVDLSAFAVSGNRRDLADMKVAGQEWADAIDKAKREGVVTSGWSDLDDLLSGGGFRPGQLIVPAGRPGIGKTTFAYNVALHVAGLGKRVAFFSTEMGREELFEKALTTRHGAQLRHAIADGSVCATVGELGELPILLDDTGGITVAEIAGKCRRMAATGGVSLIIVDYLQQIATKRRQGGTRAEEVGEVTRALKVLAKEMRVPIIAPSQLNRAATGDTVPALSNLRESGSIEQDADIVLLLYKEDDNSDVITGKLAKQRNGRVGTVRLLFQYDRQLFQQVAHEAHGFDPEIDGRR